MKRNPLGTALILSLCVGLGLALVLLNLALKAKARTILSEQRWREEQWRRISDELRSTNTAPVVIPSDLLLVLGGFPRPEARAGIPRRFRMAVSGAESPVDVARGFVPFLREVERDMAGQLARPVYIDLVLSREFVPDDELIVGGKTDFQRMGLVSYLRAKGLNQDIQVVLQEEQGEQAVIFVRQDRYDQGITNLARLVGRSFVFGNTNSSLNLNAKVLLAQAGITGANLSQFTHIETYDSETAKLFDRVRRQTGFMDMMPSPRVNLEIARIVVEGRYDAGVARAKSFERMRSKGLVALKDFEAPPDVYVARAGLDPAVIQAFRNSLLGFKDRQVLAQVPWRGLVSTNFVNPDETKYDLWRRALTNEAASYQVPADTASP